MTKMNFIEKGFFNQTIEDELFGNWGEEEETRKRFRKISKFLILLVLERKWDGSSFGGEDDRFSRDDVLRYATCLTTRAEAELFGLSDPRFCLRYYLDDDHKSFLNLRRSSKFFRKVIAELHLPIRRSSSSDCQLEGVRTYSLLQDEEFKKRFLKESFPWVIADSVLAIPQEIAGSDYHVIKAQLRSLYGECVTPDDKEDTTPFVQQYGLTSQCGHAAIFMASMLMRKYSAKVYAPSEIAAFLRRSDKDEMLITSLSARHVANYFKDFGRLRAFYQSSNDPNDKKNNKSRFENALKSYLFSGMPVMKTMDMCNLFEKIYENDNNKNDIPLMIQKERVPKFKFQVHWVLLIGCRKSQMPNDGKDFIFHDSAWCPYLYASTEQLTEASAYSVKTEDELQNYQNTFGGDCVSRFNFQPVTPFRVKMPLHIWQHYSGKYYDKATPVEKFIGLFPLTHMYFKNCRPIGGQSFFPTPDEYEAGKFRLVTKVTLLEELKRDDTWGNGGTVPFGLNLERDIKPIIEQLKENHWFWIQRFDKSFWIWDAEMEPPSAKKVSELFKNSPLQLLEWIKLLLVGFVGIKEVAGSLEMDVFNIYPRHKSRVGVVSLPKNVQDVSACRKLGVEVGLISSFHQGGVFKALEFWPKGVKNAEIYAFMRDDVREIFGKTDGGLTSVEAMTEIAISDDAKTKIETIAEKLSEAFKTKGINIRSFASFMPEIVHREKYLRERARKALLFLCRLSYQLQRLGHTANLVEIISGSVLNGILSAKNARPTYGKLAGPQGSDDMLVIREREATKTKQKWLLDELLELKKELSLLGDDRGADAVQVAIEAEPGPLYVCGSKDDVMSLCERIDDYSLLDFVGVNVDFGHYSLMGYQPGESSLAEWFGKASVLGVHFSDHKDVHAADCVVGTLHDVSDVKALLSELQKIKKLPPVVTVEMECVKNIQVLNAAVRVARTI